MGCLFIIDKNKDLLNEIYNSGEIQEDVSRYIFIALSKKPRVNGYELYQTIRLMSHITKLIQSLMIREQK